MSSQKLLHKKNTIIIYCLGFAKQILKEFKPLDSPRVILKDPLFLSPHPRAGGILHGAGRFSPSLSFRPRVRHGVTLLSSVIPTSSVTPHLMRNLESGFPPPIRSRACFHGNDRGKGNPEAKKY